MRELFQGSLFLDQRIRVSSFAVEYQWRVMAQIYGGLQCKCIVFRRKCCNSLTNYVVIDVYNDIRLLKFMVLDFISYVIFCVVDISNKIELNQKFQSQVI